MPHTTPLQANKTILLILLVNASQYDVLVEKQSKRDYFDIVEVLDGCREDFPPAVLKILCDVK